MYTHNRGNCPLNGSSWIIWTVLVFLGASGRLRNSDSPVAFFSPPSTCSPLWTFSLISTLSPLSADDGVLLTTGALLSVDTIAPLFTPSEIFKGTSEPPKAWNDCKIPSLKLASNCLSSSSENFGAS